ncbi:L-aspartate oxidase [Marinicella gelatinilytica]|uniref:L-aspartate oxidase n=1 Tax=Marinicella gelatinilytica TaxID=2996017 RepID=UPI002260AB32|nr:L-aspartate oxidase [Marinicella gelatinilytica]MCX7544438.1 L-aspartate oxidase [Marinicella gelatinilytica]
MKSPFRKTSGSGLIRQSIECYKSAKVVSELHQDTVLIIGSGIAGLSAALELATLGVSVTVITRSKVPEDCNTHWAQGGIVYRGEKDSAQHLAEDIMAAGGGLNRNSFVHYLAECGPDYLRYLLMQKVPVKFDRDSQDNLATCQEAAHSISRILHVKDSTGKAIHDALLAAAKQSQKITLLTQHTAIDLITPDHHSLDRRSLYEPKRCVGAYVLDSQQQRVKRVIAGHTILASGGFGQVYLHSSNTEGTRGDGLAMAHRAGARMINTEYVQFHPTTFHKKGAPNFLISEALRGAGGRLINAQGEAFMTRYDAQWRDLAPRDVVSRSIYKEMLRLGSDCVYLDICSYLPAEQIIARFPNIYEFCLSHGVDITKQTIPVTPAAHYACGGIWVDSDGSTDIQQLYAIGEVACTGLHGANRLASTSLLEGVVTGLDSARSIVGKSSDTAHYDEQLIPPWQMNSQQRADKVLIRHDLQRIQTIMWNYVGISRSSERLQRALRELRHLETDIEQFYRNCQVSDDLIGLRNAVRTAIIVTLAAWSNTTSSGCHYRDEHEQIS